jgi:hypothetical protein
MSNTTTVLLTAGGVVLTFLAAWVFVLKPQMEITSAIREVRNNAVMQGRDPDVAERNVRASAAAMQTIGVVR